MRSKRWWNGCRRVEPNADVRRTLGIGRHCFSIHALTNALVPSTAASESRTFESSRWEFCWVSHAPPAAEDGTKLASGAMVRALYRLASEPPFRLFTRQLLKWYPAPLRTRMRWDLSERPPYLLGIGTAALHARRHGIGAISAIEFGVAEGHGLLILEREAARVEAETGVRIHVYGFDSGGGLPETSGDYRDHPDYWVPGDFPMDVAGLRANLTRAELVIGDVRTTLSRFRPAAPVGFAAVDVDLWSSTVPCLEWLARAPRLTRTPLYFDDIIPYMAHPEAGELLAINEFNRQHSRAMIIERWYGVAHDRPFPERPYLQQMYVLHDLKAISVSAVRREVRRTAYA